MKTFTWNNLVFLAAGAALGYFVAWKTLKTKYEQIAQEEINSVKETFSKNRQFQIDKIDIKNSDEDKNDIDSCLTNIDDAKKELAYEMKKHGYIVDEDGGVTMEKPYVIPPENFDDQDDYDTVSLWYYSDGTLADFDGNVIEDVENTVGVDSLTTFGEYEDDTVFVRNDRLKTDYEILLDNRKFSDKEAE